MMVTVSARFKFDPECYRAMNTSELIRWYEAAKKLYEEDAGNGEE
jgi:hypothetical protein